MESRLSLALLKEFDAAALQEALANAARRGPAVESTGGPTTAAESARGAVSSHPPRSAAIATQSLKNMQDGTQRKQSFSRTSSSATTASSSEPIAQKKSHPTRAASEVSGEAAAPPKRKKSSGPRRYSSPHLPRKAEAMLHSTVAVVNLTPKQAEVISDRVLPPPPTDHKKEKFVQFNVAPVPEVLCEPSLRSATPVRSCFKGSHLAELMAAHDALLSDFPDEENSKNGSDKKDLAASDAPSPKVGLERLCDVSVREAKIKEMKKALRKRELAECRFRPVIDKGSMEMIAEKKRKQQLAAGGRSGLDNFHSDPLLNIPVVADEPSTRRLRITPKARKMRRSVDDLLEWGKELQSVMADARIVIAEEPPEYRPAITPRSRRIAEAIADRRSTVVEHAVMLAAANAKQQRKHRDELSKERGRDIGRPRAASIRKYPNDHGEGVRRSGTPDPSSKSQSTTSPRRQGKHPPPPSQRLADEKVVNMEWWMDELKKDTAFACNQLKDAMLQKRSLTFV